MFFFYLLFYPHQLVCARDRALVSIHFHLMMSNFAVFLTVCASPLLPYYSKHDPGKDTRELFYRGGVRYVWKVSLMMTYSL